MSIFQSRVRNLALLGCIAATASVLATVSAGVAAASPSTTVGQLTQNDLYQLARSPHRPAALAAHAAAVAKADERERGLPNFSSSFTTGGVTYPYTMVGAAPATGRTVRLKTVVVPLRMVFTGFSQNATFEPNFAVGNMIRSPLYDAAPFLNGTGQFGDQFQRATFWNQMDPAHRWHTILAEPDVSRTFTINVTPATGSLGTINGGLIGNMEINAFETQLIAILPRLHLDRDETPLFVTQSVTADALGFHDAVMVPADDHTQRVQTLMWSSWLDPAQVGDLIGDVSTLNHEVAEWMDDPFVNNPAPLWAFPPFNKVCGDNPFLEVGDPQGNGPDFALFPVIPVRINGFTYHLQDLALLQWFSRETPSSALNGWYAFPDPKQLTSPSVDCP
jgi:hypothetical protein